MDKVAMNPAKMAQNIRIDKFGQHGFFSKTRVPFN